MANELRELETRFQQVQQSLGQIMLQEQAAKQELVEIENALRELEKNPKEVYKSVGAVLVKADPKELGKELKEKKEALEVRITSLKKRQEKLSNELREIQEKLIKTGMG